MKNMFARPQSHARSVIDMARCRLDKVASLPETLRNALRAVVVKKRFRDLFPFSVIDFPLAQDSLWDLATLGYLDVNGKRVGTKSASCVYRLKPLTVALCAAAGWCELE